LSAIPPAAVTNVAAALLRGHEIIESLLPVLNYQRSAHMGFYRIIPAFNSSVTKYR
jgi:hypothetical protein